MAALTYAVGTASAVVRLFSFIFLRVIPCVDVIAIQLCCLAEVMPRRSGHAVRLVYYAIAAQVLATLLVQRSLGARSPLQHLPSLKEARQIVDEAREELQGGASSPETPSKKNKKKNKNGNGNAAGGHQKQPSYAEVAKGADPHPAESVNAGHAKKPSYAEVAKGSAHPSEEAAAKHQDPASRALQLRNEVLANLPTKQDYSRPNLLHLVFGHPSSSKRLNWVSLLANLAFVAMCADFQYTPLYGKEVADTTFVRVGAVSPTTVKVVARVPPSLFSSAATHVKANRTFFHESVVPSTPVEAARLVYRPVRPHGPWQYGGVVAAGQETDYVTAIKLESLLPSTQYEYALVLPEDQSHRFQPPSVEHPQYFTTAPDPRLSLHQTHFKFAASSCIKPGWPYVPGEDHLSIKGAADLADRIHADKIDFMVGSVLISQ
jgi:alkaline phosphatase D